MFEMLYIGVSGVLEGFYCIGVLQGLMHPIGHVVSVEQIEAVASIISGPVGLWLLSFAVFHLNPWNDPINPLSKMNHYHWDNVLLRKALAKGSDEGDISYEWPDFAAYFSATGMSLTAWIINVVLRGLCH